jgi:hypothetical protein
MYACTPKLEDRISEEQLRDILNTIAGKIQPCPFGPKRVTLNHGLHFTGGEPFLHFELLVKATQISSGLGIPSTFVETNCFWCTSDEVTREKLTTLKREGLKGIMVSVNPYYLEYVPFERTERCIRIANELFGENLMVYQLDYYYIFTRLGLKGKLSIDDYRSLIKDDDLSRRVELFLMGRAAYELQSLYPAYPPEHFFTRPCTPPLIREWHNHIDNYGNYLPGYCGGISFGNYRDLEKICTDGLDLSDFPVLKYIAHDDFKGLFDFALELGYTKVSQGYISKCHLCLDIRKYLFKQGQFEELKPAGFYYSLDE